MARKLTCDFFMLSHVMYVHILPKLRPPIICRALFALFPTWTQFFEKTFYTCFRFLRFKQQALDEPKKSVVENNRLLRSWCIVRRSWWSSQSEAKRKSSSISIVESRQSFASFFLLFILFPLWAKKSNQQIWGRKWLGFEWRSNASIVGPLV